MKRMNDWDKLGILTGSAVPKRKVKSVLVVRSRKE